MTATLLAMLIEDSANHLSWNTTITEALPHLKDVDSAYHNVTLAALGAHHAGLNDTDTLQRELPLWLELANETYPPVEARRLVVERAFTYKPTLTPGQEYHYSNLGYITVGHLIDTYAKESWEDFLYKRIFNPLGMKGCGLGPVPQKTSYSIINPWPHVPGNPDPVPVPWDTDNPPVMGPAGTVHCTIESYAKFLALHLRGFLGRDTSLLPASAFKVLHTPYKALAGLPPTGGSSDLYAPGAWLRPNNPSIGGDFLLHDGSNTVNYAWGIVAPGVQEVFFIGTNVGEAARAMDDVAASLFNNTLGF
jgi:CubicO group peptidase (beta-lactamase class C family)